MRNRGASGRRDREYLRNCQPRWHFRLPAWLGGVFLGGAALALPAVAHAWIARRALPPRAPSWGRAHRYAGRHGEIAFQQLGEGPPILLLHSFGPGHDSAEWRAVAEGLAGRGSVYVPDLPGWARSAPPRTYSPGVYVSVIEEFLAAVVREPAVVVAAGLPAAYALEVAAARPHLVRALALVGPEGIEPAVGRTLLRQLLALPLVGVAVLDLLTSRIALAEHLRREVYAAPERVDAGRIEHHYRASHRREARRALGAYLSGRLRPATASLPSADLPAWIAWGRRAAHSPAFPAATADLWLLKLPQAEVEIFEHCGSQPHAEAPAAFCRALERFLAGV